MKWKNDPVNLNEIERKILEIIKDNASITKKELSRLLNLSGATIKRKLSNLKQHNVIERFRKKFTNIFWYKKEYVVVTLHTSIYLMTSFTSLIS